MIDSSWEMIQVVGHLDLPKIFAPAVDSDCHDLEELGRDYRVGLEQARQAGYNYYVSFSRSIPEKRSLNK